MSGKPLTTKFLDALKPAPAGQRKMIADAALRGFAVRVTDRGVKSFAFRYRHGGVQRLATLGTYPTTKLADAREQASAIVRALAKGIDPEAGGATAAIPAVRTLNAVAERYFKDYLQARDRRTAGEIEQIIRRDLLRALGQRDIKSVTQRDIRDVVAAVIERARAKAERRERERAKAEEREPDTAKWQRAGVYANRVHAVVRKLFNWAVEEQYADSNPAKFKAAVEERPRDRKLTDDEIRTLWTACADVHPMYGDIVKLLLLTGQRLSEVAKMQWSEINEATGEWRLLGVRTKNRREHIVPLPKMALEIVTSRDRIDGCAYVFSTTGTTAVSGFSKWKAELDKRLGGAAPFTLHDLRHVVASRMAELEISPHVIEAVLNHASGIVSGIAGRYNTYSYLREKRHALAAWAAHVERVVFGFAEGERPPAANIAEFRRA